MHFNTKNLTGHKFGRLTVLSQSKNIGRRVAWNCQCECGYLCVAISHLLTSGCTRSCGCLRVDVSRKRMTIHGHAKRGAVIPEHKVWTRMWNRCNDQTFSNYARYGGRGIKVCERWLSFQPFLDDMGPRPSVKHSIDRINNDGNYEPGNCRWSTQLEQMQNTSCTRVFTINGQSMSVAAWCRKYGVKYTTVLARLKRGHSMEQALEVS